LFTLPHTVHTLRGMKNSQSFLAAVLVSTLAFTSTACDDDPAPRRRDGGMDRTPDLTVTEGGLDRTPDTSPEVAADKPSDTTTPDAGVDKAPDSPIDAPADVPAADMAVDMAADTAVDLPGDTTPDLEPDTSPDVTADTWADTNPIALNGCTVYEDRTATDADRELNFAQSLATDPERCIKARVGTSVCFHTSSFATHPLVASGGDTPNPIPNVSAGTDYCVALTRPGVFGYRCTAHPAMTGAIWVVP
jgi:plastocyanin